jgi:hypothetical protein
MRAESRDSAVGIATGYGLDYRGVGVRVPLGARNFFLHVDQAGRQPPIQWVPGVKRPGREANNSPPTSAELKKVWIYTTTHPYAFMA